MVNKITGKRQVQIEREPFQEEYLFVDPAYYKWYDVILFLCFVPLYFLITITEHPPEFNMLEGCWDAWYGIGIQYVLIYTLTSKLGENLSSTYGMGQVNHLRDFFFAYITILEFPYKQIAYC